MEANKQHVLDMLTADINSTNTSIKYKQSHVTRFEQSLPTHDFLMYSLEIYFKFCTKGIAVAIEQQRIMMMETHDTKNPTPINGFLYDLIASVHIRQKTIYYLMCYYAYGQGITEQIILGLINPADLA